MLMWNTPTYWLHHNSIPRIRAAPRSPNRRAPSPTKVPAQSAWSQVPMAVAQHSYISMYSKRITSQKRLEELFLTVSVGFDVSIFWFISKATPSPATISTRRRPQLRAPGSDKYLKR